MQKIYELPKTAKQIKNSKDYIDIDGSVYTYLTNYKGQKSNKLIKKAIRIHQGYVYCAIYDNTIHKNKNRRVHRVVAETYIPNPNNYTIVGHKNNIKTDNRVENLYWTTNSENIQKAVNDGLLKNDKGFQDSQSHPVVMFETTTNRKIAEYGSCTEAAKQTGLSKTTICRQAKYHRPVRTQYYFRYSDDKDCTAPTIIGMYDFISGQLHSTFINSCDAEKCTGINSKTILQQCNLSGKPK